MFFFSLAQSYLLDHKRMHTRLQILKTEIESYVVLSWKKITISIGSNHEIWMKSPYIT